MILIFFESVLVFEVVDCLFVGFVGGWFVLLGEGFLVGVFIGVVGVVDVVGGDEVGWGFWVDRLMIWGCSLGKLLVMEVDCWVFLVILLVII